VRPASTVEDASTAIRKPRTPALAACCNRTIARTGFRSSVLLDALRVSLTLPQLLGGHAVRTLAAAQAPTRPRFACCRRLLAAIVRCIFTDVGFIVVAAQVIGVVVASVVVITVEQALAQAGRRVRRGGELPHAVVAVWGHAPCAYVAMMSQRAGDRSVDPCPNWLLIMMMLFEPTPSLRNQPRGSHGACKGTQR
jgi:hypothetical protein